MSDEEADPELLELLRKSLGLSISANAPPETRVLESAQYVYDNAIDVALDMRGCKLAASRIHASMREKQYSIATWSSHDLHPKTKDEFTLNFIFTMDLLNFSFWAGEGDLQFSVFYRGERRTGYWSLVACLWRALEEGIPITSPSYWHPEAGFSDDILRNVFRSTTGEPIPMLNERIAVLREASVVLFQHFDMSVPTLIQRANRSAAGLANMLADYFPNFRDECRYEGKKVRFLKRAQIFAADLWAAFEGQIYGEFDDIDKITMFADYRIPQALHTLGCLLFSPPLERDIRKCIPLATGSPREVELRGCSIWCVELLRREILTLDPHAKVNAILIDFFLYDTMQEFETMREGEQELDLIPHHRTRSVWY